MITLLIKEKINIFINEETGRWFCFKYDLNNQVIRNISDAQARKMYSNYYEFKDYLTEVKHYVNPVNDLLNDMNYLILHTSDSCNMKCKYCYACDNIHNNDMNLMSSNTMIKAIDLKFVNS